MALVAIERAAFDYNRDEDSVQLEFSLNRIRNRLNVSSEAIPLDFELVGFLALRPWFSLTDEILKQSSLQLILSGIIPADRSTRERIHFSSGAFKSEVPHQATRRVFKDGS